MLTYSGFTRFNPTPTESIFKNKLSKILTGKFQIDLLFLNLIGWEVTCDVLSMRIPGSDRGEMLVLGK